MPPKKKTAIPAPRFLAGAYTVAEIAEIKGVRSGAIHRDLYRTRKGDRPGVVPAPDAERKAAVEPRGRCRGSWRGRRTGRTSGRSSTTRRWSSGSDGGPPSRIPMQGPRFTAGAFCLPGALRADG